MTHTTYKVLKILAERRRSAGELGQALWGDSRRGRIASADGGGDYAAQMLLGRLRKAGLVRVAHGEEVWAGCSIWELTEKGGKELLLERGRRSRAAGRRLI